MDAAPTHRSARFLTVLCVVAWVAAFTATHVPIDRVLHGIEFKPSDVLLHMAGYFGLTALLLVTLAVRSRSRLRRIATALIAVPAYGAFDELTQPLVGRTAALSDWLADIGGMLIALCLFEAIAACTARRRTASTGG
jgi:VanZ family protein